MKQLIQFGASRAETAAVQLLANPGIAYRLDGYCKGANTWLQLFDNAGVPSANDIPKKSLQLFGNDGFSYVFSSRDDVSFNDGIYMALSSDETKYTADASGTLVSGDFLCEDLRNLVGATVAGDLTTGVSNLQIWASAAGPKTLRKVLVKNNHGSDVYTFVVARDTNAQALVLTAKLVTNGTIGSLDFGTGTVPFEQDATGTQYNGCRIYCSATAPAIGAAAPAAIAATDFNIKAWYQ